MVYRHTQFISTSGYNIVLEALLSLYQMQVAHILSRILPEQPGSKSNSKTTFDVNEQEEEKYDDKSGWTYAPYEGNHGAPAQVVTRKDAPVYLRRAYVFTGYLVGKCKHPHKKPHTAHLPSEECLTFMSSLISNS